MSSPVHMFGKLATTARGFRGARRAGAGTALAASVGLGLLIGVAAPAAASSPNAAIVVKSGSGVPYQDPNAVGSIGLCNKAGQSITHGNINTKPFIWRAVSSQAAQAPYSDAGRTATLYAYQPLQELPAADWSGDSLTASSRYSNAAHPMAAGTAGDLSLKQFMGEYHPMWDGLLELRMFLGAPDQADYSLTYPATAIKVTGDTWQVVGGASVACNSGRAESIETILLPTATQTSKASGPPHPAHASRPAAAVGGTSTPKAGAGGVAAKASPVALQGSDRSGSHTALVLAILGAAAAFLGGGAVAARRRTRGGAPSAAVDMRTAGRSARAKVGK